MPMERVQPQSAAIVSPAAVVLAYMFLDRIKKIVKYEWC